MAVQCPGRNGCYALGNNFWVNVRIIHLWILTQNPQSNRKLKWNCSLKHRQLALVQRWPIGNRLSLPLSPSISLSLPPSLSLSVCLPSWLLSLLHDECQVLCLHCEATSNGAQTRPLKNNQVSYMCTHTHTHGHIHTDTHRHPYRQLDRPVCAPLKLTFTI